MSSLFCRHNRFTAECPICSKGSVLERGHAPERRAPAPPKRAASPRQSRGRQSEAPARSFQGPYVSAAPLERDARLYEVRLEKVPGGLRLAEWRAGALEKRAPVLPATALRDLVEQAAAGGLVGFGLPDPVPASAPDAGAAASAGQAGDMREELRVERAEAPGLVRVARYVYWPGDDIWELQESPVLLPEARFAEALTKAAALGLL